MSRDDWCTPKWLAEALGVFEVDPCSNDRSHILSWASFGADWGDDGRAVASSFDRREESFINPPYSRNQVFNWVRAWDHTNYTFLLRWDPSTAWFKRLMDTCKYVWFPHQRINFEPPPGVKASSNPFPHALYFKEYPKDDRATRLNQLGRFYRVCGLGPGDHPSV